MEIDRRVHLTVEALRGLGEGQEGKGCMDEVNDELSHKIHHVKMNRTVTDLIFTPGLVVCTQLDGIEGHGAGDEANKQQYAVSLRATIQILLLPRHRFLLFLKHYVFYHHASIFRT